jgi:methyltransferase-like protein/SAM-dependent methyltransferase
MSTVASRTSYDEVPYPSYPLPQTHPDHLAVIATLLGLEPPPPHQCRVLELGCASGGNLIPLALSLPRSSFVGVDLSAEQIAAGQTCVDALKLANIRLAQCSILEVTPALGQFDYILCHGVYSWVPPPVQEKILEICRSQLAPRGIAYISYNTHPGWHLRGLIRHMMSFHVGRYPDDSPEGRVGRARHLLDFLARAAPDRDGSYAALLREQAELLRQHSDAYIFHEHLEEHNEPVWFLDFCEQLAAHGLRYLAEAEFGTMVPGVSFAPDIQRELDELAPHLYEKEQYMDFARNRSFRQSLIGHVHLRPDYGLHGERLAMLSVAAPLRPVVPDQSDLTSTESMEFVSPEGLSLDSAAPIVKSALACLGEAWPRPLPFAELLGEARLRLAAAHAPSDDARRGEDDERCLREALLATYLRAHGALVRFWLHPPSMATEVAERPVASSLARWQAAQGRPITNLRHEVVPVTPYDRHLLPLLDGTRTYDQLVAALVERFRDGRLNIAQEEQAVRDEDRARQILEAVLPQQLPKLAHLALLLP